MQNKIATWRVEKLTAHTKIIIIAAASYMYAHTQ